MRLYQIKMNGKLLSSDLYAIVEIIRQYPKKVLTRFDTPSLRIIFAADTEKYNTIEKIQNSIGNNPVFDIEYKKDNSHVAFFSDYTTLERIRVMPQSKFHSSCPVIEMIISNDSIHY